MLKKIVFVCFFRFCWCEDVNIGGVFENNENLQKAFNFALENINNENSDTDFTFNPVVITNISELNPYNLLHNICSILEDGAVAIFGPVSYQNIAVAQSVCDVKEIPHIITRSNNYYIEDKTIINFYPRTESLSKAYFDIILAKGWKQFTVLYEDNESLLKLTKLLEAAQDNEILTQIMQLDSYQSGNYRATLKLLKQTEQKNIIVDCQVDSLFEILSQLQQAGLMNENFNYLITNLDAHTVNLTPFKYSNANITGIRLINPDLEYVQTIANNYYSEEEEFYEAPAWKLRLESALIIDALNMFTRVFSDRQKSTGVRIVGENNNSLLCAEPSSWEHGLSIVNLLKSYPYEGLTGLVLFDNQGHRSDFKLTVFELLEGGITDVGTWRLVGGMNVSRFGSKDFVYDPESLRNRTFIVQITLTEPYGMHKQTTDHLYGNDMFEGYAIDLIQKLSEMEGFNYTFIVREDKSNGAFDKNTKKWTGMIGDLLEHKADLAICDFTITSDREEVVDFTVPFMSLGISILFTKPENAPPSFFSFADPFALDSWILLGVAFCTVSVCFFIMGRICNDEWTNPYPCIEEPEYLVNQFSLSNSFWFATGALLAQGSEIAPIAISTRMVSGIWWYFCLIMSASYTANLAAFLATENPIKLFTDLQSLYENQHDIQYGAKNGGATLKYFTSAEKGSLLRKVGDHMQDHPENNVIGNDEGVLRAERGKYAFFMESSSIEYATQRHCSLIQYGDLLDEKGYGIAMRKFSPYRKRLSLAILKLQQNHFLDDLKKKWWEERRGGGACEGDVEESAADPLGLKNVEGCFYMTLFGTILAVFIVIIEHFFYLLKVQRRTRLPFMKIVKSELRFYLNFNSASKPNLEVVKDTEGTPEEEEDKKSETDSTHNKSKSKSASKTRTFTRSRSRSLPVLKHQKSKSRGNQTPVSYGFIIPSSLESLKNNINE